MIYDLNNLLKLSITTVIIFIIIKFLVETRLIEAILLALIITISIYVVEHIINLYYVDFNSDICQKCNITEQNNTNTIENFDNTIFNEKPMEQIESVDKQLLSVQPKVETIKTKIEEQISPIEQVLPIEPVKTKMIEVPKNDVKKDDKSFQDDYVKYQQNGEQEKANEELLNQNKFRMKIGNPELVDTFMKDGKKYYYDIYSYSTNAPNEEESMESDMKYGDYNYIGPINKGMTNPDYTYIAPSNWYPVPPFPPQCVTNKKCTTCPIQMNDGNDYMTFTPLKDFNRARRFTGNMQINTDYIKNVLNNGEGY